MKRRIVCIAITAFSIGLTVHAAEANKAAPGKQTHCPVMQRTPIDPSLYVDVKGKRVYTCCTGCIAQVKGNPDKYIQRLEDQGVVLEKTQTICPVMGGKINTAQYADVKGKRIYVCCPGCIGQIKADPDKYIKAMEESGIALDITPVQ